MLQRMPDLPQPAIVETEGFGDSVLQVELAVVVAGEVLVRETSRRIGIEVPVKEAARVETGHAAWSAGPPSRTKRRSQ